MKKILRKVIILIIVFSMIWVGSVIYSNLLTVLHSDKFSDFEAIGFDGMHPWDDEPDFRVLSYTFTKATVYYYTETGGEKALFVRDNGMWRYERTVRAWSSYDGTADDYFIWPYFKNWVI